MFRKRKDEDRKPVEQEIAELQRKFRVLENDKRACSEDSQGTIRKQRATIEKLTRENRKMKAELNETRSAPGSQAENKMSVETIAKLSEQASTLKTSLEAEEDVKKQLTDKLDQNQKQVFILREDMGKHGGVNASLDNAKAVQKQIKILENRLDKGLQKFNEAIAANRSLREQIDTLRRERVVFDDIYKKLENELQMKKKEMANIIEQANAAYEARDSAQAQMASLKQQADKEHTEFEKEWKELGRLIENDKRMKEVMRIKVRGTKNEKGTDGDDDGLRQKITRNAWDTSKSMVATMGNQEKSAAYEDAFSRIQAATGICDIDELVQNFILNEDQNFHLFKYNNELSGDIEKLEQQISEHKDEHTALSGHGNRKEDTEMAKIKESLEEKWNDIDRKAIHYEVKYQESQQTLSHIRTGVESIFRRVGCTIEDLPSGCGNGISESNMLQYCAVIEQRANELLKLYDALQQDDEDDVAKPSRGPNASTSLQIKLPSTVEDYSDDEDDDDEEDQRPFTRDELKTKTMRGISRKKNKSKLKGGATGGDK